MQPWHIQARSHGSTQAPIPGTHGAMAVLKHAVMALLRDVLQSTAVAPQGCAPIDNSSTQGCAHIAALKAMLTMTDSSSTQGCARSDGSSTQGCADIAALKPMLRVTAAALKAVLQLTATTLNAVL